jgi:hypothetical protein
MLISTFFYYYHCADTAAGVLLVPEGIIRPVVSILALTLQRAKTGQPRSAKVIYA